MKQLDFGLIKDLCTGAATFQEKNGYLEFCRYTSAQMDYYEKVSERDHLRAGASAGIMLDFQTDSVNLSFVCKTVRASSLQMGYVDIFVDGKLRLHNGRTDSDENEMLITLKMETGVKRVTVYFPCLFSAKIKNFSVDDGAAVEKVKKDLRFMFFGDSITQGYISEFPSLTYANRIARKFNAEIMNQAIGGEFFDVNHLKYMPEFDPDIIIVAYGTNDWNSEKDITTTAGEYFERLTGLYPNAKIVDILPIFRTDIAVKDQIKKYTFSAAKDLIMRVCENYGNVTAVDGYDYIPHFQNFYYDHVHPNESGYAFYADALENDLRKIF